MMNVCRRHIRSVRDQVRAIENPTFHDETQMLFAGIKESKFFSFGVAAASAKFAAYQWITVKTSADQLPFYVKCVLLSHFSLSENMLSFYFFIDGSSSISAPEKD